MVYLDPPSSGKPVHGSNQSLEDKTGFLRLAEAERLFRTGQEAARHATPSDFDCILLRRGTGGWVACARNDKTPLDEDDKRELAGWIQSHRSFLEYTNQFELSDNPKLIEEDITFPGGERYPHQFLVVLPTEPERFLALLSVRQEDRSESIRIAKSFVNSVTLAADLVREDNSALRAFEDLFVKLNTIYSRSSPLDIAAEIIARGMAAESCSIYLKLDDSEEALERVGHHGEAELDDSIWLDQLSRFLGNPKRSGLIINSSADLQVHWDGTLEPDGISRVIVQNAENGLMNMALVHLHGRARKNGKVERRRVGVLRVANLMEKKDGKRRRIRHLDLLRLRQIAAFLSLAIEAMGYRENSYTDGLTKLNNRSFLDRFCNESLEREFALAFIDLDKFKNYNERFGYRGGDTAIQTIAMILKEEVEKVTEAEGDGMVKAVAYRQGGDEFVLTFTRRHSTKDSLRAPAAEVLARVQQRSRDPKVIRGLSKKVEEGVLLSEGISLSIGTYLHQPENGSPDVSNPRIQFLGLMDEHQPERRPVILASIASRIAKSAGGGARVEWRQIANLACEGVEIVDVYSEETLVIGAGLKDNVQEGFRFEIFHEFPEGMAEIGALKKDTAFTSRTMATFQVERAYQDVSVCKVINTEVKDRDRDFWIGRKVWIQI